MNTSSSFHTSKNHHHFTALDYFYVFMHMTPHSTSRLDQVLTGVALTKFLTNTVLRICSRSQDTVNKISSYQFSSDIVCDW